MPLTAAHSITPTTSGSAALSPTEITMALRTPPLARSTRTNDKDAPLREDIRLLGRLLGEVIRQQEGEAVFKVVETIRQTAVRFRRESDLEAGADLDRLLKKLSRDQTNAVVRAFSYFSHLANIAEDQHHNRRRRAYLLAGSAPQPGSLAATLSKLRTEGVTGKALQQFYDGALISPVLTAHPTEVQRKSILDAGREIASASGISHCCTPRWPSSGRHACCAISDLR
jgi:phosphoenolpyruvate carboxylase